MIFLYSTCEKQRIKWYLVVNEMETIGYSQEIGEIMSQVADLQ